MKKFFLISLALILLLSSVFTLPSCVKQEEENDPLVGEFNGFKIKFSELDNGNLAVSQLYAEAAEVVLPAEFNGKAVTQLSYGCCKGQDKLKKLYVPEGITHIYGAIFLNSMYVEEISLPTTLTHVDGIAFNATGSISFKTINFRGSQELWESIEIVNNDKLVIPAGGTVNFNTPVK